MRSVIFTLLALLITTTSFGATRRYRLMHNSNPSTEITIGWEQQSGTSPVIHYGTVDQGTNFALYPSTQAPYRQVTYMGMNNRFAKITGLTPNTVYYFVIKDSEGTSNRYWFTTMPNDNSQTLSFISGGDSRSGTTQRQNGNRMVAKIRPHAVLFGGDLVDTPGDASIQEWLDDWQLSITTDGQMIPLVHSYGNHEQYGSGGANFMYDLFDTPYDVYYNVRYGGNLFSCYTLNGEVLPGHTIPNNTVRVAQKNWLQSTLSTDASIWKFAQYHRPIVPHNSTKGEGADEYSDWANYFYDYGVRVVAESDAHCTKITNELKPAFVGSPSGGSGSWFVSTVPGVDDPNKGITFIGEGAWGTIRVADDTHPITKASGSFYQFNWLLVDACKIEIRTIDTQSPGTVPQHIFGDYSSISAGLEAQVWKPSAMPTGVSTIAKCNPPIANFSANQTNVFTGTTINFTDLSTNSPTSWSWNFGDGVGTSTAQNPSYTYNTPGTYTVTLTCTNAEGSDTEIKVAYIVVQAPTAPTANFAANITSASVGQNISFTDLSTGVPTAWSWNFGDGLGTSTLQNPTYAYGTPGTYTVTLTASNVYGNDAEIKTAYIVVASGGTVSVFVATGNDDAEEFRTNNSMYLTSSDLEIGNDTGVDQYMGVRFQNVNVPQGAIISNARIRFRADETDAFSSQMNIYIKAEDVNNSAQFTTTAGNISGRTLTTAMYTWPDGSVPGWTADTYYDTPNLSTVIQEVVDRGGWNSGNAMSFVFWSDLAESSERVAYAYEGGSPAQLVFDYTIPTPPAPVANFSASASSACQGASISLTDMSTNNPVSWSWSVTGPQTLTSSAQNPTFNFTTPGTYSVSLVASNAGGSNTYTQTNSLTINTLPATPSITAGGATTFCTGGSVSLSAPASSSYLWSNGATTQSINATAAGSYTVQVTNAGGCQSAASSATTVTVNALPATPSITAGGATTFCAGGSVSLSAPASSSYLWSNGATTQSINATAAGSYTVQVTNAGGCQSAASVTSVVTVNPLPVIASALLTNPDACAASTGSIGISGSATGELSWTGSASGTLSNVTLPTTVNALAAGSYTFTLIDVNSCQSNAILVLLNDPTPPVTPIITASGPTTYCDGGSVTLTSSQTIGNTWSNSATSNSLVVTSSGLYAVTYTDINGCSATSAPISITVNPLPTAPTIAADGPVSFCDGGSVTLTSSVVSGIEWSTNATNPSILVNSAGTYSVVYTDGNGCEATSTGIEVIVHALPTVTMNELSAICVYSDPFTLIEGQPAGGTYSGIGVSGSDFIPSTAGIGSHSITYQFTDANGCMNTATSDIMVDECLGLAQIESSDYIIYPNPVTDKLIIECKCDFLDAEIQVFDASGRLILKQALVADPTELDLNEWAIGTYRVVVKSSNGLFETQIIKQ
ncbi:MAG: PKD domain-containing protein [Fluviicola sp.]|nr:PKD domain-containing protein [Fluviicola sp.]